MYDDLSAYICVRLNCAAHKWNEKIQVFVSDAMHSMGTLHVICYASALRPHRAETLSDALVWRLSVWRLYVCLSRTSGLSREQRGLGRQNWHRDSPRHTWLGHHFQGQKVKSQLVADVLNSQHAGTGAKMRRYCKLAGTEAYCVATRTACYTWF